MNKKAFKYQDIAVSLEARMASGEFKAGIALPPENILSGEYGVSHLTFRKAMDILVRNGRIVRRPGRGTLIADSSSAVGAGKTVLYAGDIGSHFFKELYLSVLKLSQASGHKLVTFDPAAAKDAGNLAAEMKSRMDEAGAVICNRACLEAVSSLNRKNKKTIVLVDIYDSGVELPPCYSISSNVFLASRAATEHMLNLGHRRIAFVGHSDRDSGRPEFRIPARSRMTYQGYAAAFFAVKLQMPTDLAVGPVGESVEECEKSIFVWLKSLKAWPTAFVCDADFHAAALIRAAGRLKKIAPADFSISGIGNTPWAEMTSPPLTTVYIGEKEMAEAAVLFAGQPPPGECRKMYISPKLIIRGSTSVLL
jgi:DNA-binding LacI/PurR family transcriptional regulator